ncbi:PAS domain-containing sensor histidine kinase [Dawidia soli]|uniref:histidine kinase n=1 Tax=Dawidia soli TaxID=2782352 RepID=A0AAP2D8I4_9BACT|nr:PAS domain-containing protein [Dawidia soli]MBT1687149.1 PAS domain-containing protein [Dawidia soli]
MEESKERLQYLLKEAPVSTALLTGPDLIVELANDATLKLWGKDASIIGKRLLDAMPELTGQAAYQAVTEVYRTGQGYEGRENKVYLQEADGTTRVVYANFMAKALRAADGTIRSVLLMGYEVTDQVEARKKVAEAEEKAQQAIRLANESSQRVLRESEERFRTLITETSMVGSALYTGPEIRIRYANDVMLKFWDKDKSITGKPIEEAIPELKGQPFIDRLKAVYTTGQTYEGREDRAQLFEDGKLRDFYFNYTYKALRNTEGVIYGIHHMAVDVTDSVLAKKELIENERNFRALINETPAAIIIVKDENFTIEIVNDAYLEWTGSAREDYLGKPLWQVLIDGHTPELEAALAHAMQTGLPHNIKEIPLRLKRRGVLQSIFVDLAYAPINDPDTEDNRVMIMILDVNDRVTARKKLEEARDYLQSILESLPQMAWTTNPAGEATYFNEQWYHYTGQRPHDGEGNGWLAVVHPDDVAGYLAEWNTSIQLHHPFKYEARYKKNWGEYRWHLTQGVPIFNAHHELTMWVGTCTDVHDQKIFQESLESKIEERTRDLKRSNIELQQFAYVASHDLQEPLRKIATFSEMLRSALGTVPERADSYLAKITAASTRMQALIKSILNFSQLAREGEIFTAVDLNEIVANVHNDFELLIEQKKATVRVDPLPVIRGIPLQLNQLFTNLMSNALKFVATDRPPLIHIHARTLAETEVRTHPEIDPGRPYVQLEFADNGIGFSEEYAEQIFVIFQRLNDRQSYPGTGIGLALCKKIVMNHKGEIYAHSTPGQGSTFYIILPITQ